MLIVDRSVGGSHENYLTPEQEVPEKPLPYVWETCMTLGDQWSYKPDGELPAPALERLEEIGDWMRVSGEAVHGTRPIAPYKEGWVAFALTWSVAGSKP